MKQISKITVLLGMVLSLGVMAQDKPKEGSENKEEKKEKLKITGRVQFRGVSGQTDSVYSNGGRDFNSVDWNFRRVRLGAVYEGDFWGAVVDIRLENAMNKPYTVTTTKKDPVSGETYVTKVKDRDNKGQVQEANIWVNIPFMKSKLTGGQQKVPFMREQIESAARMEFTERSMMAQAMTQWEIGLKYDFHPLVLINKNLEHYMKVDLSMTNGHGSSIEGTGAKQSLTDTRAGTQPLLISPLYAWRVQIDPLGGFLKDGKEVDWVDGEEIFQKETKLSLGIAGVSISELYISGTHNTYTRDVPNIELLNVQTTESYGDNLTYKVAADQTSPGRPRLGLVGRTYDMTFITHGLYLNGAYTYYKGSASNNLRGYQGTVGYVLPIKGMHIMPVFRYDYMAGDFNHNGNIGDEETFRNYWVGVNLLARKHDLKLQLMYQIQRDKLGTDPQTNNPSDMRNNIIYLQAQANFSVGVKTQ